MILECLERDFIAERRRDRGSSANSSGNSSGEAVLNVTPLQPKRGNPYDSHQFYAHFNVCTFLTNTTVFLLGGLLTRLDRFVRSNPGTLYAVRGCRGVNIADDAGAVGNYVGNIKVSAGSGELFTSLGTGRFNDVDIAGGNILFETTPGDGSVSVLGARDTQNYAQIGHGGWDADALTGNSGDITVTANGGGDINFSAVSFDATDLNSDDSYTQLGHGGRATNGSHFGTIDVTTVGGGDIKFTGGDYRAFAQLGHGGRDSIGNQGQDSASPDDESVSKITVDSSGAIDFAAGGFHPERGRSEGPRNRFRGCEPERIEPTDQAFSADQPDSDRGWCFRR